MSAAQTPAEEEAGERDPRSLRVLIVIELGANWGHLLRVLPVIDELRARGHRPLLAVADLESASKVVAEVGIEVVRTPGALVHKKLGSAINVESYAQILDRCVFGDDATLAESLVQWEALLKEHRPDVVLAEFSPGALYMAHLFRLPLVCMNMGWEVPPFDGTLPILRPWLNVSIDKLREFESGIVARLNRHCVEHGVAPYAHLGELYGGGVRLMCTFTETDHFGSRPGMNYVGALFTSNRGAPARWRGTPGRSARKRVLVYLAPDPRNITVLEGLMRLNVDVIAVLPGIRKESLGRFVGTNIRVWDGPVQIGALLPEADLVINNGGHGLIAASLLAGIPLLIQPIMLEQTVLARRLEEGGLAQVLVDGPALRQSAGQIASLLDTHALREGAHAFARKYAGHTQLRTLLSIVHAVERAAEPSRLAEDRAPAAVQI
jgi:UDP:flavonoid glycosyltransferase YjiC (YdhE family)